MGKELLRLKKNSTKILPTFLLGLIVKYPE
jgi:hypothetical protein